mmetsp:Transcript_88677/g.286459  ORF Transcript_88677/g.286459 Transcript_88677/m.286459 type:complete len:471 (-) Transcript_88677:317-1729(-)
MFGRGGRPDRLMMDTSNPFATFLAARPETNPRSPSKVGSHLGKFSGFKIGETLVLGGSLDGLGLGTDEASDPFYSFLAQRPTHPTHEAEWLKAEVFRTKKQLLQVAVDAELKFISDQPSPEDATRLRRIKVAQRYLEHLELIGEPFSGAGTVVSEDGRSRPSTAGGEAKSGGVADGSAGSFGGAGGSIVAAVCEEVLEAPGGCEKRVHALTSSTSLPSILGGLGSPSVGSRVGTPTAASRSRFGTAATAMTGASLGSTLRTTGALSIGTNGLPKEEKEPLLEGWYSKTRSFNIQIGKGDLQCRRFSSAMPGGTFVLGNGRVPFFTGSHLLVKGYYFAFRVDQVDPKPPQVWRPLYRSRQVVQGSLGFKRGQSWRQGRCLDHERRRIRLVCQRRAGFSHGDDLGIGSEDDHEKELLPDRRLVWQGLRPQVAASDGASQQATGGGTAVGADGRQVRRLWGSGWRWHRHRQLD